ncbi:protein mono-ADP-ribosyltransferase PARP14 [Pelodytes ibericus]
MEDSSTYQFPVALQWELGPEKLKQIKNKLLAYFQSKNKSNGGECEIKDMDCTKGYILIFFNQETVRERVLQKTHHELTISGNKLKLDVRRPEANPESNKVSSIAKQPDPKLVDKHQHSVSLAQEGFCHTGDAKTEDKSSVILIKNILDTYTLAMLNLLLENTSDKEESIDFHVEMIPEIHAAAVTFTCDIDIAHFVRDFSSSARVRQQKMDVMALEETRSIRAEGLPSNTSEDHVILYFESTKHGGGSIQEAIMVPEEDAALITFQDKAVTKKVLARKHVFGKTPIFVYPCYPSIGVTLYGKEGPSVTKPAPLEFLVSPYIFEFILSDAQRKLNIEEKMATLHCEITWPDLSCPNLVIKLCIPDSITTQVRTLAKIAPTWRDKVFTEFSLIISKYKVTEHSVSGTVWETIQKEVCSSSFDGVLIKPNLAAEKVILAGFSKDITQKEPAFRELIEATTQKINRQSQSIKISEPLDPALYEIICRKDLFKNMLSVSPELKMHYDPAARTLQFNGLQDEVRLARYEILNIRQLLKSKSIPLNPHIIQFLKLSDSKEMSCVLFTQRNISAMFEVEEDTVKLMAFSAVDLSEAEKKIKEQLVCEKVAVEDKSIMNTPEWKSLETHLYDACNADNCTFLIERFPTGAENQLVIVGLSSVVKKFYRKIHHFVETNTPLEKNINLKSMAVMHFIRDEKKQLWEDIGKRNVKWAIKQRSITLKGTKSSVLEAMDCIEKVLYSLCTDTLTINKPGAKVFCMENEDVYVTTANNKYKCVIYLQKDGESSNEAAGEVNPAEHHDRVTLPGGATIAIYNDDLTRHRVDVIVNAANEDLKHIGGLAWALLQAAGPKLQSDSDHIIRENGKLAIGDSVITDAGNLPCKQVIHTVGPRWDAASAQRCERLLRKAITRSLELAAEKGHSSIAIPAVSAGIFGFPLKRCVENIIEAIRVYMEDQSQKSSLKRIHLVDTKGDIIKAFTDAMKREFGDRNLEVPPKRSKAFEGSKSLPGQVGQVRKNENHLTTKEGLVVRVIKGNIQDATTKVIVNSVGIDLDLNSGGACKALFGKAGKTLQDELNKASQGLQAVEGSIFMTEGGLLLCEIVIHIVAPKWDGPKNSAEKMLRQILNICLTNAEKNKMRSISFPAIGTGVLGFPRDTVAALMFEEILSFSRKKDFQYLNEVNLVLHPTDTHCIEAFSSELTQRMGSNVSEDRASAKASPVKSPAFSGTVTSPALGVYEMKIGPFTYQVKTGDITKEDTDIIVNSSDNKFTLKAGVSKAILEAAGQSVEAECIKLGSIPNRGYIITGSGNLACKVIIHVCCRNSIQGIKSCVTEALQGCEKLKATSIAFPAIGTGGASLSSADVAEAMLDALKDYAKSKSSTSIQKVKVVVFQQKMLDDFHRSMTKKVDSRPKNSTLLGKVKSLWNYLTSYSEESSEQGDIVLKEDIEPAIFHLCGESDQSVKLAFKWLQELILKEQDTNTIKDNWIKDFGEQECSRLFELQKKLHVSISFAHPGSKITVSGLTRDVLKMTNEIQSMINNVREKKTKEREAELCSNLVEWRYHDGSNINAFDIMANLELEKAKTDNRQSLTIIIGGVQYTVNMELKSASDSKGKQVKIERVPKNEQSFDLPANWDQMNNDQVKVVLLSPGTSEYRDVQQEFAQTCQRQITKIERIQNQPLWLNFLIKKKSVDDKNSTTNNEKRLFHGTDPNTINNVNHNGFNRSFAGKNAACYGNGTYFAVQANYSAHNTYSRPDGNGNKYMYLARVITGISSVGTQGMVAPPPKNPSNPTDLHDSVTDNVGKPSMYVIFNDIQAYPEYLITFK